MYARGHGAVLPVFRISATVRPAAAKCASTRQPSRRDSRRTRPRDGTPDISLLRRAFRSVRIVEQISNPSGSGIRNARTRVPVLITGSAMGLTWRTPRGPRRRSLSATRLRSPTAPGRLRARHPGMNVWRQQRPGGHPVMAALRVDMRSSDVDRERASRFHRSTPVPLERAVRENAARELRWRRWR